MNHIDLLTCPISWLNVPELVSTGNMSIEFLLRKEVILHLRHLPTPIPSQIYNNQATHQHLDPYGINATMASLITEGVPIYDEPIFSLFTTILVEQLPQSKNFETCDIALLVPILVRLSTHQLAKLLNMPFTYDQCLVMESYMAPWPKEWYTNTQRPARYLIERADKVDWKYMSRWCRFTSAEQIECLFPHLSLDNVYHNKNIPYMTYRRMLEVKHNRSR